MKAARIHAFGSSKKVKIEEIAKPRLRRGSALVRIRAAAVNPVDWMVIERIYNPKGMDKVPLTLGQDFAGVVDALAPGSRSAFRKGDEVFGETFGSFAEYAVVPVRDLVRKPRSIDFSVAASIPMPALTAWQMVVDTAKASPRKVFLIHGASGGVGSFAVQFAKWKGARVVATASRSSFRWLESIGVDVLIDYKTERFEKRVTGVDVVIDPIGGDTQKRSWQTLPKGGMLINLTGEIDRAAARNAGVRAVAFQMKYDTDDLERIAELIDRKVVRPHITKVLPLGQVRRALAMNEEGRSHGKIVLRVA
ncbi:MAG TPA: NADP-dependent oxidoreductase [Thermoanaerobaculia bacterium]|nr:NADP-dependent oxidoreductase [Thermoanaerobaculia bacterium]